MLTDGRIKLLELAERLTVDVFAWGRPHKNKPGVKEVCEVITEVHKTLVKLSKIKVG